jgi:hypothetical protein
MAAAGGMVGVCGAEEGRRNEGTQREWERDNERDCIRTWHGGCVHPKMYVVPEHIQAIVAHANPRGLVGRGSGRGRGMLVLTLCLGIALHFLEEPSYCAAPRDDFRVRVVERVAAHG